jgi:integrase
MTTSTTTTQAPISTIAVSVTPAPAAGEAVTAAPPGRVGPLDGCAAEEILHRLTALPVWPGWDATRRNQANLGASAILGWLADHEGHGWQRRWINAGADRGKTWFAEVPVPGRTTGSDREVLHDGLAALLLARAVLPSYQFITAYNAHTLFTDVRRVIQPELFQKMTRHATAAGMTSGGVHRGLVVLSKLLLHTGLELDQLTFADVQELHEESLQRCGAAADGILAAWDLLRGIGLVSNHTYRAMRREGPLPTTALVDRYRIRSGPVREVLIRYLDERRPALDYKSFISVAGHLCGTFWADIEAHHPEVESLHLPEDVAAQWKQRIKVVRGRGGQPRPRSNHTEVLMQVRSFYLDIAEWALQDATWAAHAVPSPIRRGDTLGHTKHKRRVTAAMHQRVRDRLPQLIALSDSAHRHYLATNGLLVATAARPIGEEFDHDGTRYRRIANQQTRRNETAHLHDLVVVTDIAAGKTVKVTQDEDAAFWAWAVIETLRHTGIRLEELLELTHLALVSYRLPDTGELVPLLQILPSKTDQERLLLISPELASVLATIISRLRNSNGGTVPLTSHYDRHERQGKPPLPHLFQRKTGHRHEVISVATVQALLDAAVGRAGLRDAAGAPLRFTPHDFRRIFATEAVTGGLPVHITARLLGHQHLGSTQAYLAVFQDELINTYRTFLDQRRTARPQAEYREPTEDEWLEFHRHFALRKVELGTCARPYGTPCKHEHACIRCPMLRVDPAQRHRLVEIIRNLTERIAEARHNGWLGEVQGLQVNLSAANNKVAALDRLRQQAQAPRTHLGIPQVRHQAGEPAPPEAIT